MTIGELAQLYNEERRLKADLRVVKMEGWRRAMWFDATGLVWVGTATIPNLAFIEKRDRPSRTRTSVTSAVICTPICFSPMSGRQRARQ